MTSILAPKQRWMFISTEGDLIFVAEILPDVSKFKVLQIIKASSNFFWSWVKVGVEKEHTSLVPRTMNTRTNEPMWQYMIGQDAP